MTTISSPRRLDLIVRSLRLIADSLESTASIRSLHGSMLGLQDATTLVQLCMYDFQKKLIIDAKHDFDQNESAVAA